MEEAPIVTKAGKNKEAGVLTKCTLFLRNIPPSVTTNQLSSFCSEWGPVRSAFTLPSTGEQKTLVGFVHFAMAADAAKAAESLKKGVPLESETVFGEIARRKNVSKEEVKQVEKIKKAEKRKLAEKKEEQKSESTDLSESASNKKIKKESEDQLIVNSSVIKVNFAASTEPSFDKKQLFKRIRKCANVKEIIYPFEGDLTIAKIVFEGVAEARKAVPKIHLHIFKGFKMTVISSDAESNLKSHRMIVRNLPFSIKESTLLAAFSPFGSVLEITLPMKQGGISRGFAFIQMKERSEAERAMNELNGKDLAGRMIVIDWALNKSIYEKAKQEEEKAEQGAEKSVEKKIEEKQEVDAEEEIDIESVVEGKVSKKNTLNEEEDSSVSDVEIDIVGNSSDEEESSSNTAGSTVFIRNVSFATEEDDLAKALSVFGPLEYCKTVKDPQTGAPRGTAFAKFINSSDAKKAIEASARLEQFQLDYKEEASAAAEEESAEFTPTLLEKNITSLEGRLDVLARKRTGKDFKSVVEMNSIVNTGNIQDQDTDAPIKGIVVDGRALLLVPAVDRKEAAKLKKQPNSSFLDHGPQDRRNLYLLNESLPKPKTAAAKKFWPSMDIGHREQLVRERRRELKGNSNLFVSNTRLSLRHVPATVTETEVKKVLRTALKRALAYKAEDEGYPVVDATRLQTVATQRPTLQQVKLVREVGGRGDRTKGYGFAEFAVHEHSLLVLRYLTNYAPGLWKELVTEKFDTVRGKLSNQNGFRAKAPVVEFATEKSAVVNKRMERLQQQRQKMPNKDDGNDKPSKRVANVKSRKSEKSGKRFKGAKSTKK